MRSVLVLAFVLLSLNAYAGDDTVRVTFDVGGAPEMEPSDLMLNLTRLGGDEDRIELPVARNVAVALPANTKWRAVITGDAYWAEDVTFEAGHESIQHIQLWRAGLVKGTAEFERKDFPKYVTAQLYSSMESRGGSPRGTQLTCALNESRIACKCPVGKYDVLFRAQGYAAAFRSDLSVQAERTLEVGALKFRDGASLLAWIENTAAKPVADCNGEALTAASRGANGRAIAKLSRPVASGRGTSSGLMQLTGIHPGSYTLRVTCPGYSPIEVPGLIIHPSSETRLREPLVAFPPIEIGLNVMPPVDPEGRPWRVVVSRASSVGGGYSDAAVFDGELGPGGTSALPGQAPGRYRIAIDDDHGNRWASEEHDISATDANVFISLNPLAVSGTVSLGKKPVQGTLYFGGQFGVQRVTVVTDDDGAFSTVLPRPGEWRVEVRPTSGGPSKVVVKVEAARPDISIQLPETRLEGMVLEPDGQPAKEASAIAMTPAGVVEAKCHDDGSFAFEGLLAGPTELSAKRGRMSSAVLRLEVRENEPASGVTLSLVPNGRIQGMVYSDRGPVPGAVVGLAGELGEQGVRFRTTSDHEGKFEIETPTSASNAVVVVSPPGHCLQAFRFPLDRTSTVNLRVSDDCGSLAANPIDLQRDSITLRVNGVFMPFNDAIRWVQGHGVGQLDKSLRIPRLAHGAYQLCASDTTAEKPALRCAEGQVSPGMELSLSLD